MTEENKSETIIEHIDELEEELHKFTSDEEERWRKLQNHLYFAEIVIGIVAVILLLVPVLFSLQESKVIKECYAASQTNQISFEDCIHSKGILGS